MLRRDPNGGQRKGLGKEWGLGVTCLQPHTCLSRQVSRVRGLAKTEVISEEPRNPEASTSRYARGEGGNP